MHSRSDEFTVEMATDKNSSEILEILEQIDFSGSISVLYTRRPNPIKSLENEGQQVLMPLIRHIATGKIAGLGCWVIREAYINGVVKNVAYLTNLKIMPEYRGRLPLVRQVYQMIYQQTQNAVECYYTTILKDNLGAQKILEKRRKGMPDYNYKGVYTVYNFILRPSILPKGYRLIRGMTPGFQSFYSKMAKGFQLAIPNLITHELADKDLYSLLDSSGEVIACCGIWNQQAQKQHIVTAYSGLYKAVHKLPIRLLGYPNLPPINQPINYASIVGLYVKDNSHDLAKIFVQHIAGLQKEYLFLMIGMHQSHPLKPVFQKLKHIKYESKFYTVKQDNQQDPEWDLPIQLEVGLL